MEADKGLEQTRIDAILYKFEMIFGEVPDLYLKMAAQAPELLLSLDYLESMLTNSEFSAMEKQIIMLTYSLENNCELCSTIHKELSFLNDLDISEVEKIINSQTLFNPNLEALVQMVQHFANSKGHLDPEIVQTFFDAGYTSKDLASLINFIATKLITNYYANAIEFMN